MPGYVDTNLLVRLLVRDSPALGHRAAEVIRANAPVQVTSAVLLEVAHVLHRPYRRPRPTVAQALTGVLNSSRLVVEEPDVWRRTLNLYTSTSLHMTDCYLASRALRDDVDLHTFDQDLGVAMQRLRAP